MKLRRMLGILGLSLTLAASSHAVTFVATLTGAQANPPNASEAGGGAFLTLNLRSGAWTLTGEISNLVANPILAGLYGPAPAGQDGDLLFMLDQPNAEPGGPLSGSGILSPDQYSWLVDGLIYLNIPTGQYPGGEIRGHFSLVPEPRAYAAFAGLGLAAFVVSRRRFARPRPSQIGCDPGSPIAGESGSPHPPRRPGCQRA